MSAIQEAKKQVVEDIKAKISASKSIVIVDYQGINVEQDTALRVKLREKQVEYKVLKNTLVKKAFNDLGITDFDASLNGPTAIAFGSDETTAAKIICDAAKDISDKIQVKCGYVDNTFMDVAGVKKLATMPTKEELIAKMLGSMQAPIANFVGVLSAMPRGLVVALNAIAEKKA